MTTAEAPSAERITEAVAVPSAAKTAAPITIVDGERADVRGERRAVERATDQEERHRLEREDEERRGEHAAM